MTVVIVLRPGGSPIAGAPVPRDLRYRAEVMRGGSVWMLAHGETAAEAEGRARALLKQKRHAGPVSIQDMTGDRAPLADHEWL